MANPFARSLLVPLLAWSGLAIAPSAFAHGAAIEYTVGQAVSIYAFYDSGTPMAEAQVSVYSPSDPTTPWMMGTTDTEGQFTFMPDPSQPGTWEVQVRQAGHGDIISIPLVDENGTIDPASVEVSQVFSSQPGDRTGAGPLALWQRWMVIAAVVWGFIGTGLFVSARRSPSSKDVNASSPNP